MASDPTISRLIDTLAASGEKALQRAARLDALALIAMRCARALTEGDDDPDG